MKPEHVNSPDYVNVLNKLKVVNLRLDCYLNGLPRIHSRTLP
jgi:hypothetical protein